MVQSIYYIIKFFLGDLCSKGYLERADQKMTEYLQKAKPDVITSREETIIYFTVCLDVIENLETQKLLYSL